MKPNLQVSFLKFRNFFYNLLLINGCSLYIDDTTDSLSGKNDFDTHHTRLSSHSLEKDFFIRGVQTEV